MKTAFRCKYSMYSVSGSPQELNRTPDDLRRSCHDAQLRSPHFAFLPQLPNISSLQVSDQHLHRSHFLPQPLLRWQRICGRINLTILPFQSPARCEPGGRSRSESEVEYPLILERYIGCLEVCGKIEYSWLATSNQQGSKFWEELRDFVIKIT